MELASGWTSGPTHLLGSGSAKGSGKAGIRSPLNGAISMRQSCSEGSRRGDCSHGGGVICPVRLGVPGHEDICQAELRVTGNWGGGSK